MNGSERVRGLPATEARTVGIPVDAEPGGGSFEAEPECWSGPGTGAPGGGSFEAEPECWSGPGTGAPGGGSFEAEPEGKSDLQIQTGETLSARG